MFHNNIVKISEKLSKRNLLKIYLQVAIYLSLITAYTLNWALNTAKL